jgi:hypothetical protein
MKVVRRLFVVFIGGSQLLLGRANNYFYSRRIGAPPAGRADGDFVDYPSASTTVQRRVFATDC